MTDEQRRFLEMVNRTTGCWLWIGMVNPDGYGMFWTYRNGKRVRMLAHRLLYEWVKGPIPAGLVLRHTCDNPPCVNPEHMIPGTQTENVADRDERGRTRTRFMGVERCVNGHEYSDANTYWRPSGGRDCRACMRARRHRTPSS